MFILKKHHTLGQDPSQTLFFQTLTLASQETATAATDATSPADTAPGIRCSIFPRSIFHTLRARDNTGQLTCLCRDRTGQN